MSTIPGSSALIPATYSTEALLSGLPPAQPAPTVPARDASEVLPLQVWQMIFGFITTNRTSLALSCSSLKKAKEASDIEIAHAVSTLPTVQNLRNLEVLPLPPAFASHADAKKLLVRVKNIVEQRFDKYSPRHVQQFGNSATGIVHHPYMLELFLTNITRPRARDAPSRIRRAPPHHQEEGLHQPPSTRRRLDMSLYL